MEGAYTVADSHEWEELCKQLLALRYGDELQLINASRTGDLGLEAFARDSGLGFQCYDLSSPFQPRSGTRSTAQRPLISRSWRGMRRSSPHFSGRPSSGATFDYRDSIRPLDHCGAKRDEFQQRRF